METPDNQWDQKWKLNNEFDGAADGHNPGAITKISVIFNVENYTHKVELANLFKEKKKKKYYFVCPCFFWHFNRAR